MRNLISSLLILLSFAAVTNAAEEAKPAYDWQLEDSYNPPDFEKYFPDDKEAGKELDKLLLTLRDELIKIRSRRTEQSDFSQAFSMINDPSLIRNGFRNASQKRSFLLELMSRKYLSATSPNPEILEILYHAADSKDPYGTRHEAVYYGLSHLRPLKPPAVLRAFIDIAMTGNELSEIHGGCRRTRQLDEIRSYLTPYLEQRNTKERQIAILLDTYFRVQSEENRESLPLRTTREIRKVQYAEVLARIRGDLLSNETSRRIEALTTMTQNGDLFRAVDESFLGMLEHCASDPSPLVRKHVPAFLRYIAWMALKETLSVNTKAVSVLKKLSVDEDQEVRDRALECLKTVEDWDKAYEGIRRHKAAQ
jgi:hypothetical protein